MAIKGLWAYKMYCIQEILPIFSAERMKQLRISRKRKDNKFENEGTGDPSTFLLEGLDATRRKRSGNPFSQVVAAFFEFMEVVLAGSDQTKKQRRVMPYEEKTN
jgi:hypothetical protein